MTTTRRDPCPLRLASSPTRRLSGMQLEGDLPALISHRLRVIGEPLRIRILARLKDAEATVGQLADELDATHQNISRHLGVLYLAGIVTRRKVGTTVIYATADYTAWRLVEQAAAGLAGYVEELSDTVQSIPSTRHAA